MYRLSSIKRKYSATPIVKIILDTNGKEQEEMACICTGKKVDAEVLSEKIIEALNQAEILGK